MVAVTVDEVLVRLEADVADYNRKVDASARNFELRMAQTEAAGFAAGRAIRGAIGGAAAALSAQALVQLAKGALDYASSLGEVSQQLGVTTKDLQVFRYAGSQVGLSTEQVDQGLAKLTKTLGDAATGAPNATKVLQLVGFSLKEIKSGAVTAGEAVPRIADFLAKVSSPAQRAAIEIELFGRAGQKLDTLLSGGSSAIDNLRNAAEKLGIVLSDDQIQRADDTADKLSEVKQVLEANIAGVVADNAQAIVGLAQALGQLTTNIIQFLSAHPEQVAGIISGIAGAKIAGAGGAVGGYLGGTVVGDALARRQRLGTNDAANDIPTRQRELAKALKEYTARVKANASGALFGLRTGPDTRSGATVESARKEVQRQQLLLTQAIFSNARSISAKALGPGQTDPKLAAQIGALNAPAPKKTPKGSVDHTAERIAEANRHYLDDLDRANSDYLDAQADLTQSVGDRYEAELARIKEDRESYQRDVQHEKYLSQAQKDELIAAHEKVLSIREQIAEQERSIGRARDQAALDRAQFETTEELLQNQIDLADSVRERRDLELQLLAERKEAERKALQAILDTTPLTSVENDNARIRLGQLDTIYAGREDQVRRQNEGPLARYRRSLNDPQTQIEQAVVEKLDSIDRGISDAITKKLGIKDPFLSQLLEIFIQQNLLKPIYDAVGSAGRGGGGGGFLGSIFGAIVGGFDGSGPGINASAGSSAINNGLDRIGRIPAFATGGALRLGGVGGVDRNILSLNGQPIAKVSAGETLSIDPGARAASSGGVTIIAPQNFDLSNVVMTEDLINVLDQRNRSYADQVGRAAYGQAVKAAPAAVAKRRRYG